MAVSIAVLIPVLLLLAGGKAPMMKLVAILVAAAVAAVSLTGIYKIRNTEEPIVIEDIDEEETEDPEVSVQQEDSEEDSEPAAESDGTSGDATSDDDKAELFTTFQDVSFVFASGAGGWASTMSFFEDGMVYISYYDSDMGDSSDDYPNGTVYSSYAQAKITNVQKTGEYTYSAKIEGIETAMPVGEHEIVDGVRYQYTEPYGVSEGAELIIYMKGIPESELDANFVSWAEMLYTIGSGEYQYYGISNLTDNTAFIGYPN